MSKSIEFRSGRHCVFILKAHLVFVTKYRRHVFKKQHLERMKEILGKVCDDFGCKLQEFNGEDDHVHLLIEYKPQVELSKLINSLKGVSSRLLRNEYPDIAARYYKGVLWSPSYFVCSVGGESIEALKQYIEQQRAPA
jgi:putative transposase